MPFILKKFPVQKGEKIQHAMINQLGFTLSTSQKLLSKYRVFDDQNNILQNGQKIKSDFIQVALFEGKTRGLKPLFQTKHFAFLDKPSGVMVHPTSRDTRYTLLDEIRYHFDEDANLAHRIDQETSGLVLVSKNKFSDIVLKEMFENKKYQKSYLAIVQGKIAKQIVIDTPIKKSTTSIIGVKMCVAKDGKESLTTILPIQYDSVKNQTLIKAVPQTGRQHQIRVHLDSIGHRIIGDPIYGIDELVADQYLCKKLSLEDRIKYTKAKRLMLHSNFLGFEYEKKQYKIYSKLRLK
jgi:23S rRNA pseudouridine1911/1915/1917 synthase